MYNIDEERNDMDKINCVTCKHSLMDTIKFSGTNQYAICTKCNTTYRVILSKDTTGNPITDAEDRVRCYLEPLLNNKPSNEYAKPSFASVSHTRIPPNYSKVKKAILDCNTVKEFLEFLDQK